MITPNISPRRVTSNAAAGLFSAARTSIRGTQTNTQSIIRSSPDLTKEQTFGINYVDFFGSKKNSKILKKSMKTVRDSMVDTFGIAKVLKDSIKGKDGVFGIIGKIFGGIKGLAGGLALLALPFIKGFLGLLAVGGIGGLLFAFKDKIIEFFSDRASGITKFLSNLIEDVVFDKLATGEDRELRIESQERVRLRTKELTQEGKTEFQAREAAVNEEISTLEDQRQKLLTGKQDVQTKRKIDSLDRRIKFLQTGKTQLPMNQVGPIKFIQNPFDTIGKLIKNFGRERLGSFISPDALFPVDVGELTGKDRLEAIKQSLTQFGEIGDIGLVRNLLSQVKEDDVSPDQFQFVQDVLKFLEMGGDPVEGFGSDEDKRKQFIDAISGGDPVEGFGSDEDKRKQFVDAISGGSNIIKGLPNVSKTNTNNSANLGGNGNKVAMLPMNTSSNGGLIRDDRRVADGSSPTHQIHDPFDRDNIFNIINRNSLGIIG